MRTCIQSGKVLFTPPTGGRAAILRRIRAILRELLGEDPVVLLRTVAELAKLVRGEPYRRLRAGPELKLHAAFLERAPRRRPRFPLRLPREGLRAVALRGREAFIVSRRKPNGSFGFPNGSIEDELGVAATTRNWSTVPRIAEMMRATE